MKSIIFTIIITTFVFFHAWSQESRNAIGTRVGLTSGFTYQHKVDDFRGYKGMLSFREGGVQITALLESFRPLYMKSTDKMYYYTGLGAHIGYTLSQPKRGYFFNPFRYSYIYGNFAPVIGMDAIIGVEYRLSRAPITISLDAKPFFELFGQNIFRLALLDIGLSIKVNF